MASHRRVIIPYAPRRQFLPYHDRKERFAVIVAHRRCGKTVSTVNDLIKRAVTCERPEGRFAYIAPFFNQAKDVAWSYLKRYAEPVLAGPPNETELRVDLIGGHRIRLYGADNPDRLRGLYLDGVVLDEAADMHPSLWGEVIRPLLADRQGHATFIGTPKGRNSFFDMYQRGLEDPTWLSVMLRASDTGIVPRDELDAARRDMTPEQYEQEFECSFEAAIMGAYYGKEMAEAERSGRITSVDYDPHVPVHTAWDLGHSDSTVIWFFQVVGPQIHVIDHYENHGQQLPHYASVVHDKGYRYGDHWFPGDVKATVLGMDRTRVETLISLKIVPRIVTEHKVMDGINAARVMFNRVWFDAEKCRDGMEALRQYRAAYDEKKRTFKDAPLHDWASHSADGFRYLAMAWKEIVPQPAPKPLQMKGIADMTFDQLIKRQTTKRRDRV